MAAEIVIPKLGMTMEEGTLVDWIVPDGTEVNAGDPIFNLETEKIEIEVEAEVAGIVRHVAGPGTTLPPGAIIGYILAPGEDMPEVATPDATSASSHSASAVPTPTPARATAKLEGGRTPSSPIALRMATEAGLDISSITGTGPNGRVIESDVVAAMTAPHHVATPAHTAPAREVISSPVARRLAESLGVDLTTVTGTGPGGRITKEDVEAASRAPAPAPRPAVAAPTHQPGERIPIRGMRKTIANRMHASLQDMAQLTMGMEVAMDEAMTLRRQLVEEWEPEGVRPTYTDLIIKAVSKAIRQHPRMNAVFGEQDIELLSEVHIGVAVAVADGLVVPVVRNADTLYLKDIATESGRLATAARDGKLLPDDMAGQTFSITTLGSADVDFFTPIINPPNAGILGVGRIRDVVNWDGDRPVKGSAMTLSLTIDHRTIDGSPAAAFLGTVRDLLQSPFRLLL